MFMGHFLKCSPLRTPIHKTINGGATTLARKRKVNKITLSSWASKEVNLVYY
jgi:hypothetical protein